jgi:SAM-dependent methyltransferase
MRQTEIDYWDKVATDVWRPAKRGFLDNWLKRRIIAQFLLKSEWSGQKVLEIGVGCGATAALLALSCGRNWEYTGTDLSPKFIEAAGNFNLKVVQADVLSLPPGPFTRIVALDSLEHVRPEDRPEGYANIAERLAPEGLLFINMPHDRSLHKDEFDHGIDLTDLALLEDVGLKLLKYELYQVQYDTYLRTYGFVVMGKR